MLHEEDLLSETDTIQISTCHRYLSICFTRREILEGFCKSDHQTLSDIYVQFEPGYHTRQLISLENIPTELPDREVETFLSEYVTVLGKMYYPGIRHNNKYFTIRTRVYQCVKLQKHFPRDLYQFSR